MYVESTGKTIRCCEQSVSFSQSFSLRETPENYVVLTKTKPEYINCRALSPRRLVIHGAFSMYAKVLSVGQSKPEYINCRALSPRRLVIHGAFSMYAKVLSVGQSEIFTPPEGLEALIKPAECADLTALCQEQFTVSEEISAADKPPVESVLHSSVTAGINDVKAVKDKLMVGGELNLRMFYLCDVETGETAKLDYVLPFNQILDCDGVDENTRNLLCCEVMSYDVRLKNDIMSEKPIIALDVKLCLTEQGYVMREEKLVCDAFSVEYASAPRFDNLKTVTELLPVSESFMEKLSICVDSGKIDFPMFVERSCDFSHTLSSSEGCDSLCFGRVRASGLSFRLADDSTAEIRVELKVTGGAMKNECTRVVTDVEVFEDQPLSSGDCALTLYFADSGENLWSISKAHNTRLEPLMCENNLEEIDLDSPQMLLIPKL